MKKIILIAVTIIAILLLATKLFKTETVSIASKVYHLNYEYANHLEMNNLYSKVKTVKEYRYKITRSVKDTASLKKELDMYFVTQYNQHGNIITSTQFRQDNSVAMKKDYKYDIHNRIIQEISADQPLTMGNITKTTYDEINRRNSEVSTSLIRGSLISSRKFSYNDKNQVAGMDIFYAYDNAADQRTYKYDSNVNMIESRQKQKSGENLTTISYFPDMHLQKEITIYSQEGEPFSIVNEYDQYKNHIRIDKYDGKKRANYGSEIKKYTYDKNKNWINCVVTYVAKEGPQYNSKSLTTREIAYY